MQHNTTASDLPTGIRRCVCVPVLMSRWPVFRGAVNNLRAPRPPPRSHRWPRSEHMYPLQKPQVVFNPILQKGSGKHIHYKTLMSLSSYPGLIFFCDFSWSKFSPQRGIKRINIKIEQNMKVPGLFGFSSLAGLAAASPTCRHRAVFQ